MTKSNVYRVTTPTGVTKVWLPPYLQPSDLVARLATAFDDAPYVKVYEITITGSDPVVMRVHADLLDPSGAVLVDEKGNRRTAVRWIYLGHGVEIRPDPVPGSDTGDDGGVTPASRERVGERHR